MPTNNHSVKDVLEDKSLVDPEVLESPQVARRYAKGIVLCQQIGFSKGSYANLTDQQVLQKGISSSQLNLDS